MHPQVERGETVASLMELLRVDDIDTYVRQDFGQAVECRPKLGRLVVDFTKTLADPAQLGGCPVPATTATTVPLVTAGRRAGRPLAFAHAAYAAVDQRP